MITLLVTCLTVVLGVLSPSSIDMNIESEGICTEDCDSLFSAVRMVEKYSEDLSKSLLQKSQRHGLAQIFDESDSAFEFYRRVSSTAEFDEIRREINRDIELASVLTMPGLETPADFRRLVSDAAYYGLAKLENQRSYTVHDLVSMAVLAGKKSIPPFDNKSEHCAQEIVLDNSAVVIEETPYSYLIHFGLCESNSELLVYDGLSGWRFPEMNELRVLCRSLQRPWLTCNFQSDQID